MRSRPGRHPQTSRGCSRRTHFGRANLTRQVHTCIYGLIFPEISALCFAIIGMSTRADYNHEIARLQIETIVLLRDSADAEAGTNSKRSRCMRKEQIVCDQAHCSRRIIPEFTENSRQSHAFSSVDTKRSHHGIDDFPIDNTCTLNRRQCARELWLHFGIGRKYDSRAMSFLHEDMQSGDTDACLRKSMPHRELRFGTVIFHTHPHGQGRMRRNLLQRVIRHRSDRSSRRAPYATEPAACPEAQAHWKL